MKLVRIDGALYCVQGQGRSLQRQPTTADKPSALSPAKVLTNSLSLALQEANLMRFLHSRWNCLLATLSLNDVNVQSIFKTLQVTGIQTMYMEHA